MFKRIVDREKNKIITLFHAICSECIDSSSARASLQNVTPHHITHVEFDCLYWWWVRQFIFLFFSRIVYLLIWYFFSFFALDFLCLIEVDATTENTTTKSFFFLSHFVFCCSPNSVLNSLLYVLFLYFCVHTKIVQISHIFIQLFYFYLSNVCIYVYFVSAGFNCCNAFDSLKLLWWFGA